MRSRMRRAAVAALLLAAAAGAVWGLRPAPVPVEVAPVVRGPLVVTVDAEGRTRVRERFTVSAPLVGFLDRIDLEPGDGVEAGDVLARIEPTAPPLLDVRTLAQAEARVRAAEATVARAAAEVEQARAALGFAERELARSRRLAAEGYLPPASLEAAQLLVETRTEELEAARAGSTVARYELEVARAALLAAQDVRGGGSPRSIALRSPVEGRVLRLFRESAGFVGAGEHLLEVGDPSELELVVDILSTDAVRVQPGAPVLIERWGGEATLRARVRLVEPSAFTKVSALGVEEQRVNVVADPESRAEAWPALGDGYRVEARIVVWTGEGVLTVPASALFRTGERWAVFVVADGRAVLRLVEIGHRTSFEAEALRGLEAGETVILYPGDRVHSGARVRPLARPSAGPGAARARRRRPARPRLAGGAALSRPRRAGGRSR